MKEKKPFDLTKLKEQLGKRRKKRERKAPEIRVEYDDSIVAFVDLLGFSDKIKRLTKKDSIEHIRKLEWIIGNVVSPSENSTAKVNYFSDCICLSEKLPKEDSRDYLDTVFFFLLRLIHIQGELIFQGFLVRGGVSIDRHYSSEHIIFSKGLLRSYEIESKKAKNPVIMLDESVHEKIIKFHGKKSGSYLGKHHYISKVNSLLSLSIEQPSGEHILNYLSFWREVDHESYILPFFRKHKQLIEEGAKTFKKSEEVLSKYRWMAEYHNYYLLKVYELREDAKEDMLIDLKDTFGEFSQPKI